MAKENKERKERDEQQASDEAGPAEGEIEELSLEEMQADPTPEEWEDVLRIQPKTDLDRDLGTEQRYRTQRSDGSTFNPDEAHEQGLSYTPPTDPPVVPSDDKPQGVEMAAGFAPSMEDTEPDARQVPERIDNRDLDLEEKIDNVLRFNSETRHLRDVRVYVSDGVASLFGSVPSDADAARAVDLIADMPEVTRVYNYLETEA